jgi:23S rRNA pseudouridine2605 synthase
MHSDGFIMFHKPKGVTVTLADERGRKTVFNLLPPWFLKDGWMPVGRLDMDTRGLLLFTRDGAAAERITRPGSCVKTYEALVRGHVNESHATAVLRGVKTPSGVLKAVTLKVLGYAGPKTRLIVELNEGKNRHIRRMFGALRDDKTGTALKVLELKRTKIGPVALDVPSGEWRFLSEDECRKLIKAVS